jgi:DNA polymerase delta subunit 1
MDEILTERKKVKAQMKELVKDSTEYRILDSKQLFLKIASNSSFGVLAQKTGIGYLPVGVGITGLGRWVTKQVCKEIDSPTTDLFSDSNVESEH